MHLFTHSACAMWNYDSRSCVMVIVFVNLTIISVLFALK